MKLSIINLLDWLRQKGYTVSTEIHNPQPVLTGIRFLSLYDSDEERDMSVAYIGSSYSYISSPSGTILCNCNDIIYIEGVDTDQIFNECIRAFDFYNQWETDLLEAVVSDAGLDTFIELGHKVFQSPMFISGVNGQTYAITKQYPVDIHPIWKTRVENQNLPYSIIGEHHEDPYFQKMYSSNYPQIADSPIWGKKILFSNLRNHGERIGSIIAYEYNHAFHDGDVHLMNVYAKIIEKALLLHPGSYLSLSELEGVILGLLSQKSYGADVIHSKLANYGWKMHDQYLVLGAAPPSGIDSVIVGRVRDFIKDRYPGLCAVLHSGCLFIIINRRILPKYDQVIEDIRKLTSNRIRIGISLDFFDFSLLSYHFKQAKAAVEHPGNSTDKICMFQDIYLKSCKQKVSADFPALQSFIHADILRLMEYDLAHNGDYIDTLLTFCLCGCNYRETARALNIHRNTLTYRMEKIMPLLSLNPEDIMDRQVLLLSLFFLKTFRC